MTVAEFAFLRRFLKERSGLDLGPEKQYLAESRLLPLCREEGLADLAALMRALRREGAARLGQAVADAMATNETLFFRDRAPFETLRDVVLPRLAAARQASRRLRIWSAACSTGQEPYSLAMLIHEMAPLLRGWQVSILASDMSSAAITRARAGRYSQFEVQRGLPVRLLLRHFTQSPEGWTASPALRGAVEFRVQNLLEEIRGLGSFDLILCRNLLIYLDPAGKAGLLARLAGALAPDGALCLGAAESAGPEGGLVPDPAARGFYLRRGGRSAAWPALDRAS